MLKYLEIFKTANSSLLLHKGRTILTMLGVIIGVFAVIALVSMGIGVQNYVTDQFESIGSNVLFVVPGKVDMSQDPATAFGNVKLKDTHIDLIKKYAGDSIKAISPSVRLGSSVKYKTKTYYSTIAGTNAQAKDIMHIEFNEGRYFNQIEENNKTKVAILGSEVANNLFSNSSSIGKRVEINNNFYEIIGVMAPKSQEYNDFVIMPYTRVLQDFNLDNISSIAIQIKNKDQVDLATKEIKMALLRELKDDDFTIMSAQDILKTIQNILGILTTAVGAIAGISLLVGGIGIMNIMLVSVTERTKEVGLRKALGATPFAIALQFLIEAILISVGGGAIGLFFGWLASLVARTFVRTEVPLWAIGLAFGFSVFVGVVFGTYPAIKASKKDPIEALRYE